MSRDPYAAFERDVPEHLREDAMQMMAEATGGYGEHDCVCLLERDQIDAINWRAHGIITVGGEEFTFQMEDGNRNGTELLAWNDGREFEKRQATRYALQPQRHLIDKAVADSNGAFLILKWDAMLGNRKELAELPGKYAYDRFFQPGSKVETYWREQAGKHLFDIVDEETAAATRALLTKFSPPAPPAPPGAEHPGISTTEAVAEPGQRASSEQS